MSNILRCEEWLLSNWGTKSDQEKLAFFAPIGSNKTYTVLPFGPTNVPDFYTIMMQASRKEWFLLFVGTKHIIHVTSAPITIICNENIIIDDILPYSNQVLTLIHYFCVIKMFTKYRLPFKLIKCELFKSRIEFFGHDLTTYGNCPAVSKFELIENLPLPSHAISLLSFIDICSFYIRYCP